MHAPCSELGSTVANNFTRDPVQGEDIVEVYSCDSICCDLRGNREEVDLFGVVVHYVKDHVFSFRHGQGTD